jgi:hypothetical protein
MFAGNVLAKKLCSLAIVEQDSKDRGIEAR